MVRARCRAIFAAPPPATPSTAQATRKIETAAAKLGTITAAQKAEVLIEALPYLQRFWDKNIVVEKAMGVNSLPTTIVLDVDGNVRGTLTGAQDWRDAGLRAAVQRILQ